MSALKKQLISHNISLFLENNLLLFFFNYNHMKIEEWQTLKNQLSKIKQVNTLVVKNRIANKVMACYATKAQIHSKTVITNAFSNRRFVLGASSFEKVSSLFQGPTLLIGTVSSKECKEVFNIVKKQKKLIFVGGLYQGQEINHLDLDFLLQLEKLAYTNLIYTLQSSLCLPALTTNMINLYYLLNTYQNIAPLTKKDHKIEGKKIRG